MTAPRLAMPPVSRRDLAAHNSRHRPRQAIEAELLGSPVRLARAAPAEIAEALVVRLAWAGHDVRLRCPAALVRTVLAGLEPGYAHRALPAHDLLPLLLQLAAGSWPAEVVAVGPGKRLPDAVAVTLRVAGRDWPGELAGASSLWPEQSGLPAGLRALPLPVALRLGVTRLPAATAMSLQEGDTVLMQTGGDRMAGRLVLAESWLAAATRTGHGWRLSEAPRPSGQEGEWLQDGEWPMTGEDGDGAVARPEDIPVALTFDVGRTEIMVGDLARLAPGSVLQLGRTAAELVEIRANGRRIGRGELVDIDGVVGVRIIRLFDAG